MFQKYSSLAEDSYPWEFASFSYFSARFMTDVMQTLFSNPDRFPHITDCLLNAQPGHYFHLNLGDEVPIAQKYGSYHDEDENDWNHTTGIIYSPNPFILTVMTRYGGMSENIIGDLAAMFYEYTLGLDERLQQTEKLEEPAPVPAETVLPQPPEKRQR